MDDELFAPDHYEHSAAIWRDVLFPLRDHEWVPMFDVVDHAAIKGWNENTIKSLIRQGGKLGRIERRGRWVSFEDDTRELRLP